jgi:predicted amidophosphoribosyltransferase
MDHARTSIPPLRFPGCRTCPYLRRDEPEVCWGCCSSRFPADRHRACPVCDQLLASGERCSNDWCSRGDRWFSLAWSIGPHGGAWREAIAGYKYRDEPGWAEVFGRVLIGFLDDHMPWFDDYDNLLPMPAFTGDGARRSWDHVGRILEVAAGLAAPRWPFAWGLVTKQFETPPVAGLPRPARRACSEGSLRRSLLVADPAAVAGRRLLVIDDVFTEGSTLREVARSLVLAGAEEVAGLTLARQPWRSARPRPPRRNIDGRPQ